MVRTGSFAVGALCHLGLNPPHRLGGFNSCGIAGLLESIFPPASVSSPKRTRRSPDKNQFA
jgi:hypothetical protein